MRTLYIATFASLTLACAVQTDDSAQGAALTTTGCFTVGSGSFKGAIVCKGVEACGTHTGQFLWGTEVLSNGPKLDTGVACCADGASCGGSKAETRRSFECTDFVMRHFQAMGSQFDITDHAYTETMCGEYGSDSHFDVYDEGKIPEPQAGDVIVFYGHTVVISSYDAGTKDVWFNQQNAKWADGELIAKDHTTYSPGSIAPRYGNGVHCLIRAKNVCETVGAHTGSGCSSEEMKTCGANHQWSACEQSGSSAGSCKSSTLATEVPSGTCLQSAKDENWYHCDSGTWVTGESSCTATYAWCHSRTLGTSVPPRACVQSKMDDVWYQCVGDGWASGVANGSGPLGACSAEYAL